MTTRPDHHELLDAEERDLAARLGRVGPFDGPSPALDAKILAAAHAAAATRVPNRRRHFAWLGVPPAFVTGVGVAAAAVLALGLVWQMRPQYGGIAARGEADAEEEVILIAPPGSAEAPFANPPPLPASPAPSAPAERAAARTESSAPASATAKAAASASATAEPAVADEARVLAAQSSAPTEDAPTETKRAADSSASAIDGFVAEPPDTAAQVRKSHATYTSAARASAERRERASKNAEAVVAAPAPAPAPAATAPVAAAAESDATTLDRIEVTGSRIRNAAEAWSEIPVSDDSRLAVAEWLQRIRARRDDGDLEHARASLLLFQRQHPRVRLPADLRPLLTDRKQ